MKPMLTAKDLTRLDVDHLIETSHNLPFQIKNKIPVSVKNFDLQNITSSKESIKQVKIHS